MKKKIHPDSFVTIKAKWSRTMGTQNPGEITNVEINVRWCDIRYFEKVELPPRLPGYWLTAIDTGPGAKEGKTNLFFIDEKTYNKLQREIANVDFGAQDIAIIKQIKETVQEEIAKTKRVNSAISQLEIHDEDEKPEKHEKNKPQ